jgi:hypothetical protein
MFKKYINPWLQKNADLLGAYQSIIGIITIPLILVGGILAFFQLSEYLVKPDVGLIFHRPSQLQFSVTNLSKAIVREPKYQFLIYDMDLPDDEQPYLNLLIPVKILDFIRPNNALGPFGVVSLSKRGSQVKVGHHLFGYAQIQCPECEYFRRYWVYSEYGKTGWYAEIPQEEHPYILKKLAKVIHGDNDYQKLISDIVPKEARVTLK